jgi:hypothetical protein
VIGTAALLLLADILCDQQTWPEPILVANCLAPLETPEFMRLTSAKESGFCEFATSHHDRRSPPRMKIAQAIWGKCTIGANSPDFMVVSNQLVLGLLNLFSQPNQ